MLLTGGLQAGCTSTPTLGTPGIVELGVEGALPILHTHEDPLLSSHLGLGDDDSTLRYHARYLLEPGKDSWSTRVRVAMRHTTARNLAAAPGEVGRFPDDTDTYWTASASVTWRSPAMPVSADWSHGVDPLWFMPQIGQRSHRVGVRVDLSRAVTHLLPEATPQVGLDWNWSQTQSRTNTVTADSTLRLNAAILW